MFNQLDLHESSSDTIAPVPVTQIACGVGTLLLAGGLMAALLTTTKAGPGLAESITQHMYLSGVENPVTAVLLNFRSYDTLLEVAVLLIAAVAKLSTATSLTNQQLMIVNYQHQVDQVLFSLLQWLVPLAILLGGYLLWTGAEKPGGAFQAGAVIAGAFVALSLSGRYHFAWHPLSSRILLSVGLAVFILVGAICAGISDSVLQYPVQQAGLLILMIELAATSSIAAILLLLFTGLQHITPPPAGERKALH